MVREHMTVVSKSCWRTNVCVRACFCVISCLKLTGCDRHEQQHGTLFLGCFKIPRPLGSRSKAALAWVCVLC